MSTTLVIARYTENLDWLLQIPDDTRLVVYAKGNSVTHAGVLQRLSHIESRRNLGREAETYLHHCLTARECDEEGFTIFCQGDPFSHSPDFLKLLERRDSWTDIQPLSDRWLEANQVPPTGVLAEETGERIRGLGVRTELFSLHTWNPVRFVDEGALRIGRDYLSGHGLPAGTNIAAHFLRSAGWNEVAEQAEAAGFGQFGYGAIFAIRNELLRGIPEPVLHKLYMMSRSHPLYPWIFERLWLHLFGLPFHPAIRRHSGDILPVRSAVPTEAFAIV